MIYAYRICAGKATLLKIKKSGDDVDETPKKIGDFKSAEEAKQACIANHRKACALSDAAGRERPTITFI